MVDYGDMFVLMTDDFINLHLENGVVVFAYVPVCSYGMSLHCTLLVWHSFYSILVTHVNIGTQR